MNKKIRIFLEAAIVVLLLVILSWMFFKSEKIAYVDSGKLMSKYTAMEEARKEFEIKNKQWQSNIDTLNQDFQTAMRTYDNAQLKGSDADKKKAKEEVSLRQKRVYEYQQAIQQKAKEEEGRLTQQVLSKVNNYLTEYGKQHHYKFILVANNGNIGYADTGADITEEILNHLNNDYSRKSK